MQQAELETLERILDEDAFRSISQSLKELGKGEGIPKLTSGERRRSQSFLCVSKKKQDSRGLQICG